MIAKSIEPVLLFSIDPVQLSKFDHVQLVQLFSFDPESLNLNNLGIPDTRPQAYTTNFMESIVLLNVDV